jgi:serine protease Do
MHSSVKRSGKAACLVLLSAVLALGCRPREPQQSAQSGDSSSRGENKSTALAKTGPVRIVYPAAPGSFVNLTKELAPSVVHLRSTTKVNAGPGGLMPGVTDSYALGTAFVLDRKGHLVTSEHLVTTATDIRAVLHNGEEVGVKVLGRDSKLDLALLKIDVPPAQLKPVRLGDSDLLQVGEWVLALGNPHGTEVTASAGLISALGTSDYDSIAGSKVNYQSFLRTDAKIDVGNSGGPLVDTSGAVVGINSAVASQGGDMRLVIPINRAHQVFPMLQRDGVVTRAWLGVFVHPVTAEVARDRKLEQAGGALVSDVIPSSPAARAGILAGDIILEFDGKVIDNRSLPWLASTTAIGRPILVLVWRSGQARELNLVSEKMPE